MGKFIWKEIFNIGVQEIDNQHKMFLEYLNECSVHADSNDKKEVVLELVGKMNDYAIKHFAAEEYLMRVSDYGELGAHITQHKYFADQVEELQNAINSGANERISSLMVFMQDWFIRHILEEDKKYTSCIKGCQQ